MRSIDPHDPEVIAYFWRLCALEPRLESFYDLVGRVREDAEAPEFCAYLLWHGDLGHGAFDRRLRSLVGSQAGQLDPLPPRTTIGALLQGASGSYPTRSRDDRYALWNEGAVRAPGSPWELTARHAYDVAYAVLFARLPECRNCLCVTPLIRGRKECDNGNNR